MLSATVTSFDSLPHPSRSELRQFAELFGPLFTASSDGARRQAVAALSQSKTVPPAVAFFIASQPIPIAAPFLAASPCLSDETLITIARTQGAAHAKAIVLRENLSPKVIDALVSLRHDRPAAPPKESPQAEVPEAAAPQPSAAETERLWREEELRQRIKALAHHVHRAQDDRLGLRTLTPVQEALLVRFARNREGGMFATALADGLTASRWLAERILLDISGQQLATTLKALGMDEEDALFVLERFYPHLSNRTNGISRGQFLWNALDAGDCGRRVEAWRRADSYTVNDDGGAVGGADAAEPQSPRILRSGRGLRRVG
ncbi:uncharacterized protein (DUF2336 family) [Pseudorhizobium tarimense]|uniref:Uncharacterized protein (DUF2336 family) n=1 Tax=Pseudorhizobium tarimense TaxID=1079109 RepID=A0ABV2H0D4_9HYPH